MCGMTKLHILGIAGTFMGGVAALARELGWQGEGSDQAIYPPMSTQLETLGIALGQGYAPSNISADATDVVVGNALSRGRVQRLSAAALPLLGASCDRGGAQLHLDIWCQRAQRRSPQRVPTLG